MDDFSAKPGVPNMFGVLGAEADKIEPGKRMLSAMTPTIVAKRMEICLWWWERPAARRSSHQYFKQF